MGRDSGLCIGCLDFLFLGCQSSVAEVCVWCRSFGVMSDALGAFTALYPSSEITTGQFWIVLWGLAIWFILQRLVLVGILLLYLAGIIWPVFGIMTGEVLGFGILLLYGIIILAVIIGILLDLRSRLREIEGGEEDESRKY